MTPQRQRERRQAHRPGGPAPSTRDRMREELLTFGDDFVVETAAGVPSFGIDGRALVTPLRNRFEVSIPGGPPLRVQGSVADHEDTITRNGDRVAPVSARWFRMRDTCGVEVMAGEDHAFVLAVAAAIDAI